MNRTHRTRAAAVLGFAATASSLALFGCNNDGGTTRVNNEPAASTPAATSTTAAAGRAVLNVGFLPVT
jgi:hypothetical protein